MSLIEQENSNNSEKQAFILKNKNALSMAFVGDAVWSVLVRRWVFENYDFKPGKLHAIANKIVCAFFQAQAFNNIKQNLTETEIEIAARAHNANTNNVPKSSNLEEYKKSTSFEAVIGYNYLQGDYKRIKDIFQNSIANFIAN